MKTSNSIKNSGAGLRQTRAFTLIEMIGVLAVIAILASLLIPKVFNAIANARVNNAVVSYNAIKAGVTEHYAKFGSLTISNTTQLASFPAEFSSVLLGEQLIDKPFAVKVGNGAVVQVQTNMSLIAGTSGYMLDGVNKLTNLTAVCEIVITNVAAQDAYDISSILDGPNNSSPLLTPASPGQDLGGRVVYPVVGGNMYIYVTGR